jgi:hypothetical protein
MQAKARAPTTARWLCCALASAPLLACATPIETIKGQVRDQATADLVCDTASISVIQLRPLKKVQGQKQTIERGSFSAKGCGGYATYSVECVRGVCMVDREVDETLDVNKKKPASPPPDSEQP